MQQIEIVRVTFNEHNPVAAESATKVGKKIKESLSDENLMVYTRAVPRSGQGEGIVAEVIIDFPMDNIEAVKRIVGKIEALGIAAKSYHECD